MIQFVKDPDAVLDYEWDWSAWLHSGETISAHTVTPSTGITLDSSTAATASVTAWLSGGTVDTTYTVTCEIVTSDSRTDDRTIRVRVVQR